MVAPPSAASERCEQIAQLLSMPDGGRVAVEGHHQLILRALHAPGRVEVMVLIPKGNGKTTIFAVAGIEHLLTTLNPQCFIGASDTTQADEMYRFMSHFAESDEEIAERFALRPGTREIRCTTDRGFAKVLASDSSRAGGKRQAFNPSLFLCDELQGHDNPNLYVAGRAGVSKNMSKGVGSRMATLSTAGHDLQSVLGQRRAQLLASHLQGGHVVRDLSVTAAGDLVEDDNGRLTIAISPSGRTVLLEWACRGEDHPDGPDDLDDSRVVKRANPASFVTTDSIEDGRESLAPWDFARYRANVWTLGFRSWLPRGAWPNLEDKAHPGLDPNGGPVSMFIDMARYSDSAAIVAVQANTDGPWLAEPLLIQRSGGPDDPIDYELVREAVLNAWRTLPVVAVGYDPKYLDQLANELEAEGVPMEKFPQTNERMGRAVPRLRRAILADEQRLVHRGDMAEFGTEFARQIVAGKTKDLGENAFKIVKPSPGVLIDAGVSLAGAFDIAEIGAQLTVKPTFEVLL